MGRKFCMWGPTMVGFGSYHYKYESGREGDHFLAGFSLLMGGTFKVGDVIRSGDFEGVVKGIELRHTHIRASDGRDIFVPSIMIFSNPLVNYTRDGLRRLSFTLGIDYADDTGRARAVLRDVLDSCGLVLAEPAPGVITRSFEADYVTLEVFFWVDTFRQPATATIRTEIMEQCRQAVLAAGFTVSSEVSTNVVVKEPAEPRSSGREGAARPGGSPDPGA